MRKIEPSAALFAITLAGLAALGIKYGNFVPLLDPLPWPPTCTYIVGAVVVVACAGLFFTPTVAACAVIIAACCIAWALTRLSPIIHAPLSIGSWYGFSEAISTLVGVWTLFALFRRRSPANASATLTGERALQIGRILFGGACLVFGCAHFAYADYSMPFVPTWLPARMPLVYVTGACHVAAGVGLILGLLPRLAATLESVMIVLFGVLVWLPSHFAQPTPKWAGSPQNQWSETILNFLLAAVAWLIADSLCPRTRTKS
ncbi:MAG TPA: DoxX family membrane protein [Candidatus Didemnitutus sp.]|nr:DoxX family membrane protein [Candidatus Didemnitutus sp.]